MELQRVSNRSAPSATVVPILIYDDVDRAIDWLCQAFEERRAHRSPADRHAVRRAVVHGDGPRGSGVSR
jgi:hypothetical protein